MKPEVPSPAGFGVGDVNFPRTRLLCAGCPPLGWVGWISNTRTRLNENFGTPRCHVFKYIYNNKKGFEADVSSVSPSSEPFVNCSKRQL